MLISKDNDKIYMKFRISKLPILFVAVSMLISGNAIAQDQATDQTYDVKIHNKKSHLPSVHEAEENFQALRKQIIISYNKQRTGAKRNRVRTAVAVRGERP